MISDTTQNLNDVLPGILDAVPEEQRAEVEEAIVAVLIRSSNTDDSEIRTIERRLSRPGGYVAVRTSDVDLLKSAIGFALAFKAGGPIGGLAALILVLWEYRIKQVHLTVEDGLLLLSLRKAPTDGWTLAELQQEIPEDAEDSSEDLSTRLNRLKRARDQSGREFPLVAEVDGRWRTLDLG